MKNLVEGTILLFTGIIMGGVLVVIWLFSGGWLMEVMGMDQATAEVLLSILKHASYVLLLALVLVNFLLGSFSRWRKKRKQEKAALKGIGGTEHGREEKG